MAARQVFNIASRRPVPPKAQECAEASGPRPEALLAVVAVAVLLMVGPVLVAGLSILSADLLKGAGSWAGHVSMGLAYLTHARLVLTLPLTVMVARAKEDS
jgi:hypothetical protein